MADAAPTYADLLNLLKISEGWLMGEVDHLRRMGRRMSESHARALEHLENVRAAVAKAEG